MTIERNTNPSDVIERILALMQQRGATAAKLCKELNLPNSAISEWKKRKAKPSADALCKLADYFSVSTDFLLLQTNHPQRVAEGAHDMGAERWHYVPIMHSLRRGQGLSVRETVESYEQLPQSWLNGNEQDYFLLRVQDESMSPRLLTGDMVLARRQGVIENGRLGIVLIDDNEACVKRVSQQPGCTYLYSENPAYPPDRFQYKDAARIRLYGTVVKSIRDEE